MDTVFLYNIGIADNHDIRNETVFFVEEYIHAVAEGTAFQTLRRDVYSL